MSTRTPARAAHFEKGLIHLRRYVADRGATWVPETTIVDGFPLGQWVATRRREARASRLSADRLSVLDTEFPGWRDRRRSTFDEGLAAGLRHLQIYGTSVAASSDVHVDGFAYGRWQRSRCNARRDGRINESEIRQIDAAFEDWPWPPRRAPAVTVTRLVALLTDFAAHHDLAAISGATVHGGVNIGSRVGAYRRRYWSGTLSERQQELLEAVPGWTWHTPDPHEGAYRALASYPNACRTGRVPRGAVVNGYPIGVWRRSRREEFLAGRLNPAVQARLEADFPVVWRQLTRGEHEDAYDAIATHLHRHGPAPIQPRLIVDGCRIGLWLRSRRSEWLDGRLNPEVAARLEHDFPAVWTHLTRPHPGHHPAADHEIAA